MYKTRNSQHCDKKRVEDFQFKTDDGAKRKKLTQSDSANASPQRVLRRSERLSRGKGDDRAPAYYLKLESKSKSLFREVNERYQEKFGHNGKFCSAVTKRLGRFNVKSAKQTSLDKIYQEIMEIDSMLGGGESVFPKPLLKSEGLYLERSPEQIIPEDQWIYRTPPRQIKKRATPLKARLKLEPCLYHASDNHKVLYKLDERSLKYLDDSKRLPLNAANTTPICEVFIANKSPEDTFWSDFSLLPDQEKPTSSLNFTFDSCALYEERTYRGRFNKRSAPNEQPSFVKYRPK